MTQQCSVSTVNPASGDEVECVLAQDHSGPHQGNDISAQGVSRVYHWS